MEIQIWILGLLGMVGCGVSEPSITQQKIKGVEVPQYAPSNEVFRLNPGEDSKDQFEGSFLVLSPTLSVEEMRKVMQISREIKQRQSDLRGAKLESATLLPTLKSEWEKNQKNIAAKKQVIRDREAEVNSAHEAEEKKAIHEALVAESKAMSDRMENLLAQAKNDLKFEKFCEARIWMWGSSDLLLTQKFTERPSPFVVCESIYEKKGLLLETVASCEKDNNGKDYFSCFWEEGVFKTQFFQDKKLYTQEQRDAILAMYRKGEFREKVITEEDGRRTGKFGLNGVKDPKLASKWADPGSPYLKMPNMAFLDVILKEKTLSGLPSLSSHDFLFAVPYLSSPFTRESTLEWVETFNSGMKGNAFYGSPLYQDRVALASGDSQKSLDELEQSRLDGQKKYDDDVSLLEKKIADAQEAFNEKNQEMMEFTNSSHAAFLGGGGQASQLVVEHKGQVVDISLQLSKALHFHSCFDATLANRVPCAESSSSFEDLSWWPESGKISITVPPMDRLDLLALVGIPDSMKTQLIGSSVHMDLFPRKVSAPPYENLEMISGKLVVEKGGKEIYQGMLLLFRADGK